MKPTPSSLLPIIDTAQALENLRRHFASLVDARVAGRTLYRLDETLMLAFCAMLCEYESYEEMALFARSEIDWLRSFLELKNGTPSHDVFRNLFAMVKAEALVDVLSLWCGELSGKHIAIDGKALRGTYDAKAEKCLLHVLRAWVGEHRLSAGHVTCLAKSNEIEALPRLLQMLQLKGATITMDAMGCQCAAIEQIHAQGADYLIALKANQKGTFQAVKAHFDALDAEPAPAGHLYHESNELSHGRYVRRECQVSANIDWYDKSWKWHGLQSVVRMRRYTHRGQQSGELLEETHYFISSLAPDAKRLAQLIRDHWSVENSCHHVLDVTFSEDHCQVRDTNAAHSLSVLREMTASLLKAHPAKASIRLKRKRAALEPAFRNQLLALIPLSFDA